MRRICPSCRRIKHSSAFAKESAVRRRDRVCKVCWSRPKINPWYNIKKRKNAKEVLPRVLAESHNAVTLAKFRVTKIGHNQFVREEWGGVCP